MPLPRRPSKKSLVIAIVVAVVAVMGGFVTDMLLDAGAFRSLEPVSPSGVQVLEGFSGGTEDVVFRANGREAFVSAPNFQDPSRPGAIFLVDVEARTLTNVTPPDWRAPGRLQPHGLDLWRDAGGERLFVVSHPGGSALPDAAGQSGHDARHTVEIFDVADDGTLTHARTVEHELFVAPNDVAAVGPGSFYVTNDHGHAGGVLRALEDFVRLRAGTVLFIDDDGAARVVMEGTSYANGVQTSADGRTVFVAQTTFGTITRLRRDPTTNELTVVDVHETGTGVDNIDVAPDGALWVGAHPKLLAFLAHAKDPAKVRAPTEVLRLVPRDGEWEQTTVYLSEGDPLSGSSVAATNGRVVVVGSVFDPRVLVWER